MQKVIAIKKIRIYANVVSKYPVSIGGAVGYKSKNLMQWVDMAEGDVREDISLVLGIDPKIMPHKQVSVAGSNLFVVPLENTEEFHALLRMEQAGD